MLIVVPDQPVPFSRPRFNGKRAFNEPKYTAWKERCGFLAKRKARTMLSGAVNCDITAFFKIPKSWPKYKQEAAQNALHTSRPDADNITKAVLDALNGIAYADDAQVARITIVKRWSIAPRVEIRISEAE